MMEVKTSKQQRMHLQEKKAYRVIDIELESGYKESNVLYQDIGKFIRMVDEGEEDFLILHSEDGYVQFFGFANQFVGETRCNLSDNEFCVYAFINREKALCGKRITLSTPFGDFTPEEREVVSFDVICRIVQKYYENTNFNHFIKLIPCADITKRTKREMGLIK